MNSGKLAKVFCEFRSIQRCTHQNYLEATPPLKQVTDDNHEKVGQRVSLVDLVENNM